MKKSILCPSCQGTGFCDIIENVIERAIEAQTLKASGLSVRQIMRRFGYQSPNSVSYLLKKKIAVISPRRPLKNRMLARYFRNLAMQKKLRDGNEI